MHRNPAHCESAEEAIARNEKLAQRNGDSDKYMEQLKEAMRSKKEKDLFPEREKEDTSLKDKIINVMQGKLHSTVVKEKCERNIYSSIQTSPYVKILLGALKAAGCEVDLRRHFSCESCDAAVIGGFDPYLNQVIVCENRAVSENKVQGILTHELIHMFDFCRKKMDLNDIRHLACTEIRAANLTSCSFIGAVLNGTANVLSFRKKHEECVKKRAVDSVVSVRDVTREQAMEAVNSVFERCYNDLEPIGRRVRRNSNGGEQAYMDRVTYYLHKNTEKT